MEKKVSSIRNSKNKKLDHEIKLISSINLEKQKKIN